jgi:hypothetical protein
MAWTQTLARVISRVDWTDPQVQGVMAALWRTVTGGSPAPTEADRLAATADATARFAARLAPAPALPSGAAAPAAPASGPPAWDGVVEALTVASGDLKEAMRFAREDGVDHPEAVRRIAHAQTVVDTVERFHLRPEVTATWPAPVRQVVEGHTLPQLRRARQALHNRADGGPPTLDSLTAATAALGTVVTQARVAAAVAGLPPGPAAPLPDLPPPPPLTTPTPSAYAPEATVDTGCLPCGRAHLGAVAGTLDAAARLAQTRGMADPETQAALATAAEELAMVQTYDWTPARIAASPPADRALLERYAPQVTTLRQAVAHVHDPAAVAALAAQAQALHAGFVQDDLARSVPGAAAIVTTPWGETGQHGILPPPWWTYEAPTPATVGATTVPTDAARAFDQLAARLAERGVRIRIRNTPSGPEGVLEGAYLPATRTIVLGPAALAKDAYAVQVLAHEAAHALADNPACHAYDASRPYTERPEERQAQWASLIALEAAGLPVELYDGEEVPPGTRSVDWDLLRAELAPPDLNRLTWTSRWIADALQGTPRDYTVPTCPPTTPTEEGSPWN